MTLKIIGIIIIYVSLVNLFEDMHNEEIERRKKDVL
jgi:uncharacterized membrane protein